MVVSHTVVQRILARTCGLEANNPQIEKRLSNQSSSEMIGIDMQLLKASWHALAALQISISVLIA